MSALRYVVGDAREVLRGMGAGSVHTVVTSPPYFGLRDYKLEASVWGGEAGHAHEWGEHVVRGGPGQKQGRTSRREGRANVGEQIQRGCGLGQSCACGAWCGTLGLEPTPEMYVAHVVEVFSEVWRVLRTDGTLWLNLGDSYVSNGRYDARYEALHPGRGALSSNGLGKYADQIDPRVGARRAGLKTKDLLGIPWRVAFALQSAGWYLRSDVIWSKPNPMPESVTDRPTRAHEYVFLLTKSARYFYDAEAIREPHAELERPQSERRREMRMHRGVAQVGVFGQSSKGIDAGAVVPTHEMQTNAAGRNKRSVWDVPTNPFPETHFATFPVALVEPCVLAGTSEAGCCPQCGVPWRRQTQTEYRVHQRWMGAKQDARHSRGAAGVAYREPLGTRTLGWQPACAHHLTPVPCVVLDPFAGAGTVGVVADRLGRDAILIELNPEYVAMAQQRLQADRLARDYLLREQARGQLALFEPMPDGVWDGSGAALPVADVPW